MTEVGGAEVVEVETGRRVPLTDVDRWSRQLVRALERQGVPAGDRVAMLLTNSVESIAVMRGIMFCGLHIVPVAPYLSPAEVAYIIQDSGSKALLASPAVGERLLDAAQQECPVQLVVGDGWEDALAVESDEPLPFVQGTMMRYSSGTTGRPKGIVMRDVPAREGASRDFLTPVLANLALDSSSRVLLTAPVYHAGPMVMAGIAQLVGASMFLMDAFDAELALETVQRERITHSYWVPTMFGRLLRLEPTVRAAYDVSSQVAAIHVGAPCPRPVKEAMMGWFGPVIHEIYGGSEGVGMTYARPDEWLAHPGTVGQPIGCDVHICAPDGAELPVGDDGSVYFDTGSVGFEYHGAPEKMLEVIHPDHPTWVTLGDVGHVDADGFLYLTDRRTDVIVSGGVNIYSREVEAALVTHPAVRDVVVVGVPDDDFGEGVAALVEVAPGSGDQALADELREHVAASLARLKRPRRIAFTDEVPRVPTGKARKQDVLEAMAAAAGAGRSYAYGGER
jgi:fatty-acyl-CoA synthase